jgi:hypothetical protein
MLLKKVMLARRAVINSNINCSNNSIERAYYIARLDELIAFEKEYKKQLKISKKEV